MIAQIFVGIQEDHGIDRVCVAVVVGENASNTKLGAKDDEQLAEIYAGVLGFMQEYGADEFAIHNGERRRFTTGEVVPCARLDSGRVSELITLLETNGMCDVS